ncbi:MAG: stage II sporulation protein M [Vampirovibrionales bacterium]|nr:stage II sporulation protein M [Vampirovibrionales bacterium]
MSKISKYWLNNRKGDWARLEELLAYGEKRVSGLQIEDVRELGFLYRAVMNDLSRIRSARDHQHLEPYLNELLTRGHGYVYQTSGAKWRHIWDFFLVQFPCAFRAHSLLIAFSFLMFVFGATISMWAVAHNPSLETAFLPPQAITMLDKGVLWMDDDSARASAATFLMQNNIRVAFNAYVSGIFFGIGTLYVMLVNGMQAFGGPLQVCFNHGMGERLLRFCSAHGVIELTTVFIAGGAGLLIGKSLIFPGAYRRLQALQHNAKESLVLILGCVPLLVIAGLIEGLVSLNQNVAPWIRYGIAGLSAIGLVLYLGFSGRTSFRKTKRKRP